MSTEQNKTTRISLPGGWHLICCDDPGSPHKDEWFLSRPNGVWVAKFWDGPNAGRDDCLDFAFSLGVNVSGIGPSDAPPREIPRWRNVDRMEFDG